MPESTVLDQYIARLQNIRSFNIHTIDEKGEVAPWYDVSSDVVGDLVIQAYDLATQVQIISGQIQFWGRMESQCKRVWQIEERNYRRWRDSELLALTLPPEDAKEAKAWKKPTEKVIEAMYRQHPEYDNFWDAVERAEEAYNAAHAILEGFRAKKEMLRSHVYRGHEDGAVKMSV